MDASRHADAAGGGLLVQDTSFEGYGVCPAWIVEGYSTMLTEIEQQLEQQNLKASTMMTPVGVGSLAQAEVSFCKSHPRTITVLATEPDTAACLHESLKAGASETLRTTGPTICDGMNCGTVSPIAWPVLRSGIGASVTVPDTATHAAVKYLESHGVNAGPCGAATLATLRKSDSTRSGCCSTSLGSRRCPPEYGRDETIRGTRLSPRMQDRWCALNAVTVTSPTA